MVSVSSLNPASAGSSEQSAKKEICFKHSSHCSYVLKEKNFDIELFLEKQATDSKITVLELKHSIQNSVKDLEKNREQNENVLRT